TRLTHKGALVARVQGTSLVICNTHLIANHGRNWARENRFYQAHHRQLEELADVLARIVQRGSAVVLSGDFNIPKWSELYTTFVRLSHATDVFAADDTPTFHAEFLRVGS